MSANPPPTEAPIMDRGGVVRSAPLAPTAPSRPALADPLRAQLEELYSLERRGIKLGLGPTQDLLQRCGNPQLDFPIIQIAGTNGKGSTAALAAHILKHHGLKAGLFTSPHLARFHERIRVDGVCIEDRHIGAWMETHRAAVQDLETTFFEATTAMALSYFKAEQVDIAVLETGLGGRLDATTATGPSWTALTPIALDHMETLGDTIEAIAREKAGILRPGVPCFSARQTPAVQEVIQAEGRRVNSPVTFISEDLLVPRPLKLPGDHQHRNAQLAWTLTQAVLGLKFDEVQATLAVETTIWPGRYQQVRARPKVIYDVAHNPHGVGAFIDTLRGESIRGRQWLVLALQQGKNAHQVLDLLLKEFDRVIITQTETRHFLPAVQLAALAGAANPKVQVKLPASLAIRDAVAEAGDSDLVAILGSHYLGPVVAEVFKISFDRLS